MNIRSIDCYSPIYNGKTSPLNDGENRDGKNMKKL